MKKRYLYVFFVLFFASLFVFGCRKPFKKPRAKPKSGSSVTVVNAMNPYVAMVGATGVFLVTREYMKNSFNAKANDTPPITSSFMNRSDSDININISLDGDNWESKEIEQRGEVKITSGEAGIIGIESDSNFYQVEESNAFLIKEKDGELTFHSH